MVSTDRVQQLTTSLGVISLLTATCLIVATDKLGRRLAVLLATVICTVTMLAVGILGLVPRSSTPLRNFLIFVACLWSFGSNARE